MDFSKRKQILEEPSIENADELLKRMEDLSSDGTSWSQHLPFDVALDFYQNEELRETYGPHVESCDLCKALLEGLHPTKEVLEELQQEAIARQLENSSSIDSQKNVRSFSDRLRERLTNMQLKEWSPQAGLVTAGLIVGILGAQLIPTNHIGEFVFQKIRATQASAYNLAQLETLRAELSSLGAEESNVERSLRYARLNFILGNRETAYQEIFSAMQENGDQVGNAYVAGLTKRAINPDYPAPFDLTSERDFQLAIDRLTAETTDESLGEREPDDNIRIAYLQTILGQDASALASIRTYAAHKPELAEFKIHFDHMIDLLISDLLASGIDRNFGQRYSASIANASMQ